MKIEVFFNENIKQEIINFIDNATDEIHCAIYRFNDTEIFNAFLAAIEKKVTIWMLIHEDSENMQMDTLVEKGANIYKIASNQKMLHHKFLIIDRKKIITGSYNWTYGAFLKNYENVVSISEAHEVCNKYLKQFDIIKKDIDDAVAELIRQIIDEEGARIAALQDYAAFVTDYVKKYKKAPPKEIIDDYKKKHNSQNENSLVPMTSNPNDKGLTVPTIPMMSDCVSWWNGLDIYWRLFINNEILKRGVTLETPSNWEQIFSTALISINKDNYRYYMNKCWHTFDNLYGVLLLKNLSVLWLNGFPVKNIAGLNELTKLYWLSVNDASLKSLEGIEDLMGLKTLSCYNNPLVDSLKNLENLPNLETVICDSKFHKSLRLECKRMENIGFYVDTEEMKSLSWKDKNVVIFKRKNS